MESAQQWSYWIWNNSILNRSVSQSSGRHDDEHGELSGTSTKENGTFRESTACTHRALTPSAHLRLTDFFLLPSSSPNGASLVHSSDDSQSQTCISFISTQGTNTINNFPYPSTHIFSSLVPPRSSILSAGSPLIYLVIPPQCSLRSRNVLCLQSFA
jgi:hypothetical protein